MLLGLALMRGFGWNPRGWTDPKIEYVTYPDIEADVRAAQIAERGKFQFAFFGYFAGTLPDSNGEVPQTAYDPTITTAVIASRTSRIGLAVTKATAWSNAYDVARQFKTLDSISNGRMAVNIVTGANGISANAYGTNMGPSHKRYTKAYEFTEAVQGLWGTWGLEALKADREANVFTDYRQVKPISFSGDYVHTTGVIPIPPSKQGQPVIFHAGGSQNSIAFAGRYADVMVGSVWTIEQAKATRDALRQAAIDNGRDPDKVKFIAGIIPLIGDSKRDALERHASLFDERTFYHRVIYIGRLLGVEFGSSDIDRPIDAMILDNVHITPYSDPRLENLIKLGREGWTLRDIIYHSVIDYHPTAVGDAKATADHLCEWFESGAADGFWVVPDTYDVDLKRFVDEVVPILQERGVFHEDYEGDTLRENLGIDFKYGLDIMIDETKG